MAKRKKSIFYYLKEIFRFLFKIVYLILKALYFALAWLGNKVKSVFERKQKNNEETTKDKSTKEYSSILKKDQPIYEGFSELKSLNGSFNQFENELLSATSLIGIILGARGTGKSAIGLKLLENIKAKTSRNVCAMGFKSSSLPSWINAVSSVEEMQNNSIVLLDEAGIEFSSRESMSSVNKILSN